MHFPWKLAYKYLSPLEIISLFPGQNHTAFSCFEAFLLSQHPLQSCLHLQVCVWGEFSKDEITPYWMETIHSNTEPEAGVMYLNRAIPQKQSTIVRREEQVQKALPWPSEKQMLRTAEMILEQEKRIRGSVSSPRNALTQLEESCWQWDQGSGDSSQLRWGMMLDPQRCNCGLRDYSSRKWEIPLPKLHS